MKVPHWLSHAIALLVGLAGAQAEQAVSFAFSGFIEFEQRLPVPGFSVGDQFYGTYTFNPLTIGKQHEASEITLDTEYWAITSWSVTIPSKGISFNGSTGEIAVGNNSPLWFRSDRYIVTMFPDTNNLPAPVISGHQFRFFQIDVIDMTTNVFGGDLLADSSLPVLPPDLALVDDSDRRGRFVFNDASYQNRMTSLTVVPEPSTFALMLTAGMLAALGLRRARGEDRSKRLARNEEHLK